MTVGRKFTLALLLFTVSVGRLVSGLPEWVDHVTTGRMFCMTVLFFVVHRERELTGLPYWTM